MKDEDEKLMLRVKENDEPAFEKLFEKYSKPVMNFAFKLTGNYQLSADIMEEAFFKLHKYRKRYSPKGKFTTYLFTIAKNTAIDKLRKSHGKVVYREDLATGISEPSACDRTMMALSELEPEERQILVLKFYYNFKYSEIAKIMNIAEGTVKSRFHRIREKMLEQFKNGGI